MSSDNGRPFWSPPDWNPWSGHDSSGTPIHDHVNEPLPFDTESLPRAFVELHVEVEAVLSLVELKRSLREWDVEAKVLEARLLSRAVDHLVGGSPTIDWSMFSRLIERLDGRLRVQHHPGSNRSVALDTALEATRKADRNDF
jgi:hypothetical protein